MTTNTIEKATNVLRKLDPNKVVFFVGAGFTRDLGYPTWPSLVQELATIAKEYDLSLASLMQRRLERGDLLTAADPFFEPEVPPNARATALKSIFETAPELKRRHRLLGGLPCLALVTTNFDPTLERASTLTNQSNTLFRGPLRFQEFNSNVNLRQEALSRAKPSAKPILKIHNDAANCETLILTSRSFKELTDTAGFSEFYRNSLRNHHVIFIGFGGEDPNLHASIITGMESFAGLGPADCFIITARGWNNPLSRLGASNIHTVEYDPHDDHQELETLLKELNDSWAHPSPSHLQAPSVFEILIPAIKEDADSRVLDLVARRMVAEAARKAGNTNENSVINQLAQTFRIDPTRARELLRKYSTSTVPTQPTDEPAEVLAKGIRTRCIAFDKNFRFSEKDLVPFVRSTIENTLVSQGCAAALALLRSDSPSALNLSHAIRESIRNRPPAGMGDADVETLEPAIADLFMRPNTAEASILNRLAITSTAFGLIQAVPSLETTAALLPKKIYLDTNIILPLLAKTQPRYSAYATLQGLAKDCGSTLCALGSFVNEVEAHYRLAIDAAHRDKLTNVGVVRQWANQGLPEFRNVFLLGLAQSKADDADETITALRNLHSRDGAVDFAGSIERLGIHLESLPNPLPDDLARITQTIVDHKDSMFANEARKLLAEHEAFQLIRLRADSESGVSAWFVTADTQLRNVVRTFDLPGAGAVLPVGPAMSLLDSLTTGRAFSAGFTRSLWSPNQHDAIDDALGKEIMRLTATVDFSRPQPIAEARKRAHDELLARTRRGGASDHLSDRGADITQVVRESVFLALGATVETEGRKE